MRVVLRLMIVGLAAAGAFASIDASFVERWYSTGFYPRLQQILTPVTNLVPFAWLDVITVVAVTAVILTIVFGIRRARHGGGVRSLAGLAARLLVWGAAVYLAFLVLWGLNYRRIPMSERIRLDAGKPTDAAVVALGTKAVEQLNALDEAAHAQGWRAAPWREPRLRASFAAVLRDLSDAPPAVPSRLKSSMLGPYFRWASVDGMINPFGLESIGNPDLLPFEKPFVAAHEWAHLAGYADESEASFVGWLACVRADAPSAYSGWLFLYWQIRSEVDGRVGQQLARALGPGPRHDVEAIAERLRQGQVPLLRDASWRAYDRYLKANRVQEGVRSYGAVVTLIVRARFGDGWTPQRRTTSVP